MNHKIIGWLGVIGLTGMLCGCAAGTSTSTVIEYDADGRIIRRTESAESLAKAITDSTKNKTVILWESGWTAGISCGVASFDDPTPHVRIFADKADKGMVSALPNQTGWDGIANAILMTKQDLNVGLTGVSNTASGTAASETSAISPASAPSVMPSGK